MENISKEIIQDLLLKTEAKLHPTQKKLCIPIINRICKKMKFGIRFSGIKVENNTLCDGHHRYVASLLANIPVEQFAASLSPSTVVLSWTSVIFEDEDWDTQAKIDMLNEQDAEYNNIPIEKMIELLK